MGNNQTKVVLVIHQENRQISVYILRQVDIVCDRRHSDPFWWVLSQLVSDEMGGNLAEEKKLQGRGLGGKLRSWFPSNSPLCRQIQALVKRLSIFHTITKKFHDISVA